MTFIKGHGLELQLHITEWDKWVKCFDVPHAVLPENPFVGFSAATGDAHDAHE
jgi:mannose-binding lectin 2